jgi:hypothetical protein
LLKIPKIVIPGTERSEGARNPDAKTMFVSGFRAQRFKSAVADLNHVNWQISGKPDICALSQNDAKTLSAAG